MHPSLALASALVLMAGAACAQDNSPSSPARTPTGAAIDDGAGTDATQGSGSSEPSSPATQESQGLRLDNLGREPVPAARGAGQDCTNQGAATSAIGAAAVDCGPGETRKGTEERAR